MLAKWEDAFKTDVERLCSKCFHLRLICYFFVLIRFLHEILMNISKGINARLDLGKKSEKEQMALTKEHQRKINFWTDECREVSSKMFLF